jgi:predicted component of type VI protein secretion system
MPLSDVSETRLRLALNKHGEKVETPVALSALWDLSGKSRVTPEIVLSERLFPLSAVDQFHSILQPQGFSLGLSEVAVGEQDGALTWGSKGRRRHVELWWLCTT